MNGSKVTVAEWQGHCPICGFDTIYSATDWWFRDSLVCTSCPGGGSIPRERALMLVIESVAPQWRDLQIHESSPVARGASAALARDCRRYIATQYWPDTPLGTYRGSHRCEDLEAQTFPDEMFDLVVTQDVMEHVFHPDSVYREVWRTLKPGGLYVHTTPIYKDLTTTERRATIDARGDLVHLAAPEYHGNPVDQNGSLVTYHYGYDLPALIAEWTGFDVEIRRFHDRTAGIVAEFTEVIICKKPLRG